MVNDIRVQILFILLVLTNSAFARFKPEFKREIYDWNKTRVTVFRFKSSHAPIFSIRIVFDGMGSYFDAPQKDGLSDLAFELLMRGTTMHDEESFVAARDLLAAGMNVDVDRYDASLEISGLNENLDAILALAGEAILSPAPTNATFTRILRSRVDRIKRVTNSSTQLANSVFIREISKGTPYERSTYGRLSSLEKMKFSDAKMRLAEMIGADRIKVMIIGGSGHDDDIVYSQTIAWLKKTLLARNKISPSPTTPPSFDWDGSQAKNSVHNSRQVILVDRPGVSEATVVSGFPAFQRNHPDYTALSIVDTAVGGYFGSRFNMGLREKSQLTYSASSIFATTEDWGVFQFSSTTQISRVAELLNEMRRILTDIVAAGLRQDEFECVKKYILGSFPLSLDNEFSVASREFEGVEFLRLPEDFMEKFVSSVENASLKDVNSTLKKDFKLDRMLTVVVGDAKKIRPILKANGALVTEKKPQEYF